MAENHSDAIEQLFTQLEAWKRLPAYRLELRIDALIGLALPAIFKSRRIAVIPAHVIPEFPIRIGMLRSETQEVEDSNRSYKVDFFAKTVDGRNLFIEFKSDSESVGSNKDDQLAAAAKLGMTKVLQGLLQIEKASKYKPKYMNLRSLLAQSGLMQGDDFTASSEEIELWYIQSRALPGDDKSKTIYFDDAARSIRDAYPDDALMLRFADSLDRWKDD